MDSKGFCDPHWPTPVMVFLIICGLKERKEQRRAIKGAMISRGLSGGIRLSSD